MIPPSLKHHSYITSFNPTVFLTLTYRIKSSRNSTNLALGQLVERRAEDSSFVFLQRRVGIVRMLQNHVQQLLQLPLQLRRILGQILDGTASTAATASAADGRFPSRSSALLAFLRRRLLIVVIIVVVIIVILLLLALAFRDFFL